DRDTPPVLCDAVITPPLVVMFGTARLFDFFDKPVLEHTLNRAVQCSGAQFQLAPGSGGDVLHDRVTVPLAVRHRCQDVEKRGGELPGHSSTITNLDIPKVVGVQIVGPGLLACRRLASRRLGRVSTAPTASALAARRVARRPVALRRRSSCAW